MNTESRPSLIDAADQLEAIGHAVITTDGDGTVLFWNPAAEQLYGWTSEEALGQNIATLTVPMITQDVGTEIMAALWDGVPWSGSFLVRRKDGRVFPALVTDSGIYRDGELQGIVGVSTNLGAALRPMLERSTDAALVLSMDASITYASPAVKQLFGWDEADIVGTSVVPLLHPDDRKALADFLAVVVGQPGAHPPVEMRVRRDGNWVWAEAALTNLLDDPAVHGVVCNLRVSVRREAHVEAAERAAQLQVALDSRLLVEQAKGYLAAKHDVDTDAAFLMLRSAARSHHRSLKDVARSILAGEPLPST